MSTDTDVRPAAPATASATRRLADIGLDDVQSVGGKGANLGELIRCGLPVPAGFVITAQSFTATVEAAGCRAELADQTTRAPTLDDADLGRFAERARALVRAAGVPAHVASAINAARSETKSPHLAVRSSATAEDSSDTSFAGMHASFTNVAPEQLIERVLDCWVSLYGDRAVAYRAERELTDEPAIAVVVQEMLASERSGVMFTTDDSGDSIVIEAAYGLGEFVVAGTIEPDSYHVDRATGRLVEIHVGDKSSALVSTDTGEEVRMLDAERAASQVLTPLEVVQLSKLGLAIEDHYECPQDIEFVFVGDQLSFVQSRPVTFSPQRQERTVLLHGLGVGRGRASGRVPDPHQPEGGQTSRRR